MQEIHIYIETDSTSPRVMRRKYGYVLECFHSGNPETRDGFGTVDGSWHKAVLCALVEAVGRLIRPCEVHIHTDNEYVLCMMEKHLEHWAVSDFVGSKGKPVAGQEEWKRLWELSREHLLLSEPGKHAYSGWLLEQMGRMP